MLIWLSKRKQKYKHCNYSKYECNDTIILYLDWRRQLEVLYAQYIYIERSMSSLCFVLFKTPCLNHLGVNISTSYRNKVNGI